jgi:hypothetical protein
VAGFLQMMLKLLFSFPSALTHGTHLPRRRWPDVTNLVLLRWLVLLFAHIGMVPPGGADRKGKVLIRTAEEPLGGQSHRSRQGRGFIRCHNTETALGLERVNALRQVMGPGRFPQLLECHRIDFGVWDVYLRNQPVEQGVGALYDDVEGLDIVYSHVTAGCHLRLRAFEVDSNQDTKLFVHTEFPSETDRGAAAPV